MAVGMNCSGHKSDNARRLHEWLSPTIIRRLETGNVPGESMTRDSTRSVRVVTVRNENAMWRDRRADIEVVRAAKLSLMHCLEFLGKTITGIRPKHCKIDPHFECGYSEMETFKRTQFSRGFRQIMRYIGVNSCTNCQLLRT